MPTPILPVHPLPVTSNNREKFYRGIQVQNGGVSGILHVRLGTVFGYSLDQELPTSHGGDSCSSAATAGNGAGHGSAIDDFPATPTAPKLRYGMLEQVSVNVGKLSLQLVPIITVEEVLAHNRNAAAGATTAAGRGAAAAKPNAGGAGSVGSDDEEGSSVDPAHQLCLFYDSSRSGLAVDRYEAVATAPQQQQQLALSGSSSGSSSCSSSAAEPTSAAGNAPYLLQGITIRSVIPVTFYNNLEEEEDDNEVQVVVPAGQSDGAAAGSGSPLPPQASPKFTCSQYIVQSHSARTGHSILTTRGLSGVRPMLFRLYYRMRDIKKVEGEHLDDRRLSLNQLLNNDPDARPVTGRGRWPAAQPITQQQLLRTLENSASASSSSSSAAAASGSAFTPAPPPAPRPAAASAASSSASAASSNRLPASAASAGTATAGSVGIAGTISRQQQQQRPAASTSAASAAASGAGALAWKPLQPWQDGWSKYTNVRPRMYQPGWMWRFQQQNYFASDQEAAEKQFETFCARNKVDISAFLRPTRSPSASPAGTCGKEPQPIKRQPPSKQQPVLPTAEQRSDSGQTATGSGSAAGLASSSSSSSQQQISPGGDQPKLRLIDLSRRALALARNTHWFAGCSRYRQVWQASSAAGAGTATAGSGWHWERDGVLESAPSLAVAEHRFELHCRSHGINPAGYYRSGLPPQAAKSLAAAANAVIDDEDDGAGDAVDDEDDDDEDGREDEEANGDDDDDEVTGDSGNEDDDYEHNTGGAGDGGGSNVAEAGSTGVRSKAGPEHSVRARAGFTRAWQPGLSKYSNIRSFSSKAPAALWRVKGKDKYASTLGAAEAAFEAHCRATGTDISRYIRPGYVPLHQQQQHQQQQQQHQQQQQLQQQKQHGGPTGWSAGPSKYTNISRYHGTNATWTWRYASKSHAVKGLAAAEAQFEAFCADNGIDIAPFRRQGHPWPDLPSSSTAAAAAPSSAHKQPPRASAGSAAPVTAATAGTKVPQKHLQPAADSEQDLARYAQQLSSQQQRWADEDRVFGRFQGREVTPSSSYQLACVDGAGDDDQDAAAAGATRHQQQQPQQQQQQHELQQMQLLGTRLQQMRAQASAAGPQQQQQSLFHHQPPQHQKSAYRLSWEGEGVRMDVRATRLNVPSIAGGPHDHARTEGWMLHPDHNAYNGGRMDWDAEDQAAFARGQRVPGTRRTAEDDVHVRAFPVAPAAPAAASSASASAAADDGGGSRFAAVVAKDEGSVDGDVVMIDQRNQAGAGAAASASAAASVAMTSGAAAFGQQSTLIAASAIASASVGAIPPSAASDHHHHQQQQQQYDVMSITLRHARHPPRVHPLFYQARPADVAPAYPASSVDGIVHSSARCASFSRDRGWLGSTGSAGGNLIAVAGTSITSNSSSSSSSILGVGAGSDAVIDFLTAARLLTSRICVGSIVGAPHPATPLHSPSSASATTGEPFKDHQQQQATTRIRTAVVLSWTLAITAATADTISGDSTTSSTSPLLATSAGPAAVAVAASGSDGQPGAASSGEPQFTFHCPHDHVLVAFADHQAPVSVPTTEVRVRSDDRFIDDEHLLAILQAECNGDTRLALQRVARLVSLKRRMGTNAYRHAGVLLAELTCNDSAELVASAERSLVDMDISDGAFADTSSISSSSTAGASDAGSHAPSSASKAVEPASAPAAITSACNPTKNLFPILTLLHQYMERSLLPPSLRIPSTSGPEHDACIPATSLCMRRSLHMAWTGWTEDDAPVVAAAAMSQTSHDGDKQGPAAIERAQDANAGDADGVAEIGSQKGAADAADDGDGDEDMRSSTTETSDGDDASDDTDDGGDRLRQSRKRDPQWQFAYHLNRFGFLFHLVAPHIGRFHSVSRAQVVQYFYALKSIRMAAHARPTEPTRLLPDASSSSGFASADAIGAISTLGSGSGDGGAALGSSGAQEVIEIDDEDQDDSSTSDEDDDEDDADTDANDHDDEVMQDGQRSTSDNKRDNRGVGDDTGSQLDADADGGSSVDDGGDDDAEDTGLEAGAIDHDEAGTPALVDGDDGDLAMADDDQLDDDDDDEEEVDDTMTRDEAVGAAASAAAASDEHHPSPAASSGSSNLGGKSGSQPSDASTAAVNAVAEPASAEVSNEGDACDGGDDDDEGDDDDAGKDAASTSDEDEQGGEVTYSPLIRHKQARVHTRGSDGRFGAKAVTGGSGSADNGQQARGSRAAARVTAPNAAISATKSSATPKLEAAPPQASSSSGIAFKQPKQHQSKQQAPVVAPKHQPAIPAHTSYEDAAAAWEAAHWRSTTSTILAAAPLPPAPAAGSGVDTGAAAVADGAADTNAAAATAAASSPAAVLAALLGARGHGTSISYGAFKGLLRARCTGASGNGSCHHHGVLACCSVHCGAVLCKHCFVKTVRKYIREYSERRSLNQAEREEAVRESWECALSNPWWMCFDCCRIEPEEPEEVMGWMLPRGAVDRFKQRLVEQAQLQHGAASLPASSTTAGSSSVSKPASGLLSALPAVAESSRLLSTATDIDGGDATGFGLGAAINLSRSTSAATTAASASPLFTRASSTEETALRPRRLLSIAAAATAPGSSLSASASSSSSSAADSQSVAAAAVVPWRPLVERLPVRGVRYIQPPSSTGRIGDLLLVDTAIDRFHDAVDDEEKAQAQAAAAAAKKRGLGVTGSAGSSVDGLEWMDSGAGAATTAASSASAPVVSSFSAMISPMRAARMQHSISGGAFAINDQHHHHLTALAHSSSSSANGDTTHSNVTVSRREQAAVRPELLQHQHGWLSNRQVKEMRAQREQKEALEQQQQQQRQAQRLAQPRQHHTQQQQSRQRQAAQAAPAPKSSLLNLSTPSHSHSPPIATGRATVVFPSSFTGSTSSPAGTGAASAQPSSGSSSKPVAGSSARALSKQPQPQRGAQAAIPLARQGLHRHIQLAGSAAAPSTTAAAGISSSSSSSTLAVVAPSVATTTTTGGTSGVKRGREDGVNGAAGGGGGGAARAAAAPLPMAYGVSPLTAAASSSSSASTAASPLAPFGFMSPRPMLLSGAPLMLGGILPQPSYTGPMQPSSAATAAAMMPIPLPLHMPGQLHQQQVGSPVNAYYTFILNSNGPISLPQAPQSLQSIMGSAAQSTMSNNGQRLTGAGHAGVIGGAAGGGGQWMFMPHATGIATAAAAGAGGRGVSSSPAAHEVLAASAAASPGIGAAMALHGWKPSTSGTSSMNNGSMHSGGGANGHPAFASGSGADQGPSASAASATAPLTGASGRQSAGRGTGPEDAASGTGASTASSGPVAASAAAAGVRGAEEDVIVIEEEAEDPIPDGGGMV